MDGDRYHLLVYHCLDVAACGKALLEIPRYGLDPVAAALGWRVEDVESLFLYFLTLHDVGKMAPNFQAFAPEAAAELKPITRLPAAYSLRHDALGWLLWHSTLAADGNGHRLGSSSSGFWQLWALATMGHHGVPPDRRDGLGVYIPLVSDYFHPDDLGAARAFDTAMQEMFLPEGLRPPEKELRKAMKLHTWRLAGMAVLADWLGSSISDFRYQSTAMPLERYWHDVALPAAKIAVARAGLAGGATGMHFSMSDMLPVGAEPSELQRHAGEVELDAGAQIFILEDVTGSGKTEAALLLAHRLMAAGNAQGFYFALPTMATATQMYGRVGKIYRRMFDPGTHPSLVLAHSARNLVDGFRESVVVHDGAGPTPSRNDAGADAGGECSAWLADSRKKALLADAGVGTIDQALLAVLPVRHQSLRMLGLLGKVLIVDEVHAYDSYMLQLLTVLLEHHARSGGSAILLSATMPLAIRQKLLAAFSRGRGLESSTAIVQDMRYPLATHVGRAVTSHSCPTRDALRRVVRVVMLHTEDDAVERVVNEAATGRCVGWIRNTVDDARRACRLLGERVAPGSTTLFHSRFALGDRLAIEQRVVDMLGRESTGAIRRGRILVGTQVLEQSLDYDVDVMISDWAPIDLIIQRAGRLMRHARTTGGDLAEDGIDARGDPVLYVLVPPLIDPPAADWYAALFPKAQYVYDDTGRLWLGAQAQYRAGGIDTPGDLGAPGSVRVLIESVYGDDAGEIPPALEAATNTAIGDASAEQAMGTFNALRLDVGYSMASSARWTEDERVPTRLGEDSRTVYLALASEAGLGPLMSGVHRPWENSAVRVDAKRFHHLGQEWGARFGSAIEALRQSVSLLREPAFVLPLAPGADGVLRGTVAPMKGGEIDVWYDPASGLEWAARADGD